MPVAEAGVGGGASEHQRRRAGKQDAADSCIAGIGAASKHALTLEPWMVVPALQATVASTIERREWWG